MHVLVCLCSNVWQFIKLATNVFAPHLMHSSPMVDVFVLDGLCFVRQNSWPAFCYVPFRLARQALQMAGTPSARPLGYMPKGQKGEV